MSTSPTCSSIERLRWTIPMPPSRASAIAIRASVTVSIAAETTGTSSAIVRVSRVAVETSFGSTRRLGRHEQHVVEGEALLGRTSRSGRARSRVRSTAKLSDVHRETVPAPAESRRLRASDRRLGGCVSSVTSTAGLQPARVARVEAARADLERRRRAGGDRRAQRLLGGPAGAARGEERAEQRRRRSRPSRPARPAARRPGSAAHSRSSRSSATQPDLGRDEHVARAHARRSGRARARSPRRRGTPGRRAPRPRAGSARRGTAPPRPRAAAARRRSRARPGCSCARARGSPRRRSRPSTSRGSEPAKTTSSAPCVR